MSDAVWLLTEKGLRTPQGNVIEDAPFESKSVTAGAAAAGAVGVIADEHEVWIRSGVAWRKQASSDIDLYCIARAADGRFLVGTASARLAWLEDETVRFLESFDRVPERPLWDTPYGAPPELRSLAIATDGGIYADVHVGWIVRSMDGGRTWRSLRNGLDRDVHQVATHPSDPKTVFAATAEGFHISHDRGDTFARRVNGMPYVYQRGTACFPRRDVYLVSTARHNQGAGAQLYWSDDEGNAWTRVQGLPEKLDENIDTQQIVALAGGHGFVIVNNTSIYETIDWGRTWRVVGRGLPRVNALLAV